MVLSAPIPRSATWSWARASVAASTDRSFDTFFHNHYDELLRTLTFVTNDHEVAKDCVQEAFIRAALRWRQVQAYDAPVTWLRRVAINRSRDLYRSEARRTRREALAAPGDDALVDHGTTIAGSLRITGMLKRLPAQQRSSAALFYLDDLSVADIANQLGISTGTVKFHLNQARAALRHEIERSADDHAV